MRAGLRVFLAFALAIVVYAGSAGIPQADGGSSRTTTPVVRFIGKSDSVIVTTTFTTATFTVTTSTPTRLTVGTGTDKANLVSTPDSLRTDHVLTVAGLSPDTAYYGLVTATRVKGAPSRQWVEFTTAAPGSAPARVTTPGGRWLLNGQRFVPVVAWVLNGCVTPALVVGNRAMNIQTMLVDPNNLAQAGCGDTPTDQIPLVHQALTGKQMWWAYRGSADFVANPQDPNQAEMIGWPGSSSNPPTDWGIGNIVPCQIKVPAKYWEKRYTGNSVSGPPGKAVYLSIDATDQSSCQRLPTLDWTFWLGVVKTGPIGAFAFYTQSLVSNKSEFDVALPAQQRAAALTAQLATLGPVLTYGARTSIMQSAGASVGLQGWKYGGKLYVLATSVLTKTSSTSVGLPGVKAGSVKAMFGTAQVRLKDGKLNVKLGGLATAWFVVAPEPAITKKVGKN